MGDSGLVIGEYVVANSIEQVNNRLQRFRPNKKWYRFLFKRSAVALILRQSDQGLEVLMIKRAEREGDPWSGHMAFPGGRMEAEDTNSLHTARRETWEEIGLDIGQHGYCLERLSDTLTHRIRGHRRMVVTPYLFFIDTVPELSINYEVAEVLWIPVDFLLDDTNREQLEFEREGKLRQLPCYYFQQHLIWGLSLLMLDELLRILKNNH